jgi:aminopeptidase N
MNPKFMMALLLMSATYGQSVDFEEFPELVANYTHLQLELQVTEGPEIRGDAVYQLTLLRDDIDSLKLDAVRMEIDLVEWDGESLEYRMRDNEMIILLPDDTAEGGNHSLRVQYRANPSFGIFEDHKGTIWSSGLPGTVRHWLPGMDHPRNSLTTDIAMIFPGGKNAVITGVPGESSAESVDLQRLRFHTESAIPLSSLRFAIGDFDRSQTSVGRHQIFLHSERGLLSDEQKANLLDDAFIAFRHAERTLETSYPSRVLHLVVL